MAKVIKKDLLNIKKEYGLPRKTVIEDGKEAVYVKEEIKEQEVIFVMDRFGYAKLLEPVAYDRNKETVDNDNKYVFSCMNTDKIVIFTDNGNMHQIKVLKVPAKKVKEKGVPIDNLGNYSSAGEGIVAIFAMQHIIDKKLLFTTKTGMMKLVDGSEFDVVKRTIAATKLSEGDEIVGVNITRITTKVVETPVDEGDMEPVMLTGGSDDEFFQVEDEQLGLDFSAMGYDDFAVEQETTLQYTREILVLQTDQGNFLRFPLKEIPEKKKSAIGVKGIKLSEKDYVRAVYLLDVGDNKTVEYKGKKVELRKLRIGKRGGRGSKAK
jgi:DNA gyrase subunit A